MKRISISCLDQHVATFVLMESCSCVEYLEHRFGALLDLGTPLYEKGGRLYCVCEPDDITRESLIKRFASHNPSFVDNSRAYFRGDLGFKPGQ